MKVFFLIPLLSLISIANFAQDLHLEWAKSIGGIYIDDSYCLASDDSGNVYITGQFEGTIDFDPGTSTYYLSSNGGLDIFVQKLSKNGNFVWAKTFGGIQDDVGHSISIDVSGDVYLTGRYRDTVIFRPGITSSIMTSKGWDDIFILKLNSNGNYQWVNSIGGSQSDVGLSIATHGSDNVFVTGWFTDSLFYNPNNPNTYLTGFYDAFILKLDGGGSLNWIKSWGGTSSDEGVSVEVDPFGDVYITGRYVGNVDFNPDTASASTYFLTSNAADDAYILKLDTSGKFVWAKSVGGPSSDGGHSIISDTLGNVYVTGRFKDSADFDPDTSTYTLSSTGNRDVFILKLSKNGNLVWAKSIGGISDDLSKCITTDVSGNLYITGQFQSTVDFDPSSASFNLTSKGQLDGFILKLKNNGDYIWAKSFGGIGMDWGNSLFSVDTMSLYVSGGYFLTADFDPSSATYNLSSNGQWDAFGLKLSKCGLIRGVDVITACDSYTWVDGKVYTTSNTSAIDTFINSKGCDSVVTLNLTIKSVDASVTKNNQSISATATNAHYQWVDCNDNYSLMSGDTLQVFTPTSNGNYAVIVRQGACVDTSECVEITGLYIDEYSKNKMIIHPNPTTRSFTIELLQNREGEIQIFNSIGNKVYNKFLYGNSLIKVDLPSNINEGIYIVKLISDNSTYTEKLILLRE